MRYAIIGVLSAALGVSAAAAPAPPAGASGPIVIKKLGYPRTAFHRPALKSVDDMRRMFLSKGPDVRAALSQLTTEEYAGTYEDLARAAQEAEVVVEEFGAADKNIPLMAVRDKRTRKPRIIRNVVWGGPEPFKVFRFKYRAAGQDWTVHVPIACGNFWITGAPVPVEYHPKVQVSAPGVCVTQSVPVTVTVADPRPGTKVTLSLGGRSVDSFDAVAGSSTRTLPGLREARSYELTATLDGAAPASASFAVRPCPPTCESVTAAPSPVRRGKPFAITVVGRVHPDVSARITSVSAEIQPGAQKVDGFTESGAGFTREGVVVRKAGTYTISATVTDDLGQSSTGVCQTTLEVTKPPLVPFGAAFVGKERLARTEFDDRTFAQPIGRCAALMGIEAGLLKELGDTAELQLSLGGKFNLRDSENSSLFADLAIERVLSKGFVGGGLSFWDITKSDTRSLAALVQGGVDLNQTGSVQFVVEGRLPFDEFDDLDNNYQFWGGLRIRPARK